MSTFNTVFDGPLPSYEQMQKIVDGVERIAATVAPSEYGNVEFGFRRVVGSNDPAGERVVRRDGVISTWDVAFSSNVGADIHDSEFDYISIFSPSTHYDALGNKFSRFKKFYVAQQTIGTYAYIWFCENPIYNFYRVPECFKGANGKEYDYLDIGCYEGAEETHEAEGGTQLTCLVSKPEKIVAHNRSCASFYSYAKNCGTVLGVDAEKEENRITTISEITEVLQPIILTMIATRNSQNTTTGYVGHQSSGLNSYTGRPIRAYDRSESGEPENVIYIDNNAADIPALHGYACLSIDGSQGTDNLAYYRVANSETVTGNISDGVFTAAEGGTEYIKITLDRAVSQEIEVGTTFVVTRPNFTGETDAIQAAHGTASQNGFHSFKMLGIENIWADAWMNILDVRVMDCVPYVCRDLTQWVDNSGFPDSSAWVQVGYTVSAQAGYATAMGADDRSPDVQLTTAVGGSTTQGYCDYCYANPSGARTIFFGGRLHYGTSCGLFCWDLRNGVGGAGWYIGARLSHLALAEGV